MHRDCAIEPLQPENSTRERRKRSGGNVEWLQASGSNRANAAYETAEDASPHACNVWWRTRVTLPACDACKAMLRSCAIPAKFGPQPAIRTQKPLFLRQRGIPRFPSVGVKLWGDRPVSIRDQRVHSARCRPLHHNRHRCWSGWLDTIQRPPASDAGTLPAELHPACWLPHLESHQGPIAYRAIALDAELYGSVEALQPSHATPDRCFADWPRLRNRNAPSVAFSSREEKSLRPRLLRSRPRAIGHAMSLGRPGAHR
jgi:hypothetical protein